MSKLIHCLCLTLDVFSNIRSAWASGVPAPRSAESCAVNVRRSIALMILPDLSVEFRQACNVFLYKCHAIIKKGANTRLFSN